MKSFFTSLFGSCHVRRPCLADYVTISLTTFGSICLAGQLVASALLGSLLFGVLIPTSALVITLSGLALRRYWES